MKHNNLNFNLNLSFPRTKKAALLLPGMAGQLEVATSFPSQAPPLAIMIICHPDPRQEGTMNNKVVVTMARAADRIGCATVRFNFRGIGASQGSYGHTLGEIEDLKVIIAWVKQVLPALPIVLAGFSFGSYISAKVASEQPISHLISIAPPVNHYDFSKLPTMNSSWLIVQGNQDEVVPYGEVMSWYEEMQIAAMLVIMSGVSHFFHGRLLELQEIIEQNLRRHLT